jgi:hypothetical protein
MLVYTKPPTRYFFCPRCQHVGARDHGHSSIARTLPLTEYVQR